MAEGGNYIHYGVREFGMAAIMNGLVLHGGFRPYGGTFLMFSEYARNAIRMAALMKINPIYVFTHDSIGVGEDGPTHQPIEQTATLRMVPNLDVWRPCDTVEAFIAWQVAVEHKETPTALILTRQNLAHQARDAAQVKAIRKGGYVLKDCAGTPKAVIIATGSEVSALAIDAQKALADKGVRCASCRCRRTSCSTSRTSRLPRRRAAARHPARRRRSRCDRLLAQYVGLEGAVVGIDRFGECGPAGQVFEYLGVTAAKVTEAVETVIAA
jgi:transketolase